MRILFLGAETSPIHAFLESQPDPVLQTSEPVTADLLEESGCELAVSHGYRHLVGEPVLERLPGRILNLHISKLPWNRGADPNLWSFLEDTPSGVSIHVMDPGVDTGPLLLQKEVEFDRTGTSETLSTTYRCLQETVERLFRDNWEALRSGGIAATPQRGKGTFHRLADKAPYRNLLRAREYETPICELIGKAKP